MIHTTEKAWGVQLCLSSPEINGTQSNQHASQNCSLFSQHNGSIIIEPPVR